MSNENGYIVSPTQLTPAQRPVYRSNQNCELDESQTCAKTLYVSTHERVNVTPENVNQLFEDICRYESPQRDSNWPLIDKMSTHEISIHIKNHI